MNFDSYAELCRKYPHIPFITPCTLENVCPNLSFDNECAELNDEVEQLLFATPNAVVIVESDIVPLVPNHTTFQIYIFRGSPSSYLNGGGAGIYFAIAPTLLVTECKKGGGTETYRANLAKRTSTLVADIRARQSVDEWEKIERPASFTPTYTNCRAESRSPRSARSIMDTLARLSLR